MEDKKNKITIKIAYSDLKIYINELLHLKLNYKELKGLQSWIGGDNKKSYFIEYTFAETEILSEYADEQMWKDILIGLDEKL